MYKLPGHGEDRTSRLLIILFLPGYFWLVKAVRYAKEHGASIDKQSREPLNEPENSVLIQGPPFPPFQRFHWANFFYEAERVVEKEARVVGPWAFRPGGVGTQGRIMSCVWSFEDRSNLKIV